MRQHLEHLAAALGLLVFALLVSWYHTGPLFPAAPIASSSEDLTPLPADTTSSFATTTLPGFDLATSTLEALFPAKTATTTPAPTFPIAQEAPPTPKPTPIPPPAPPAPKDELAQLKGAIVNILCISHRKPLRSTSGSGVVIDSRGTVLTVAHVAQSLLLEEYLGSNTITCNIRTGSPATDSYAARPIYVSEAWIRDNPTTLISSQPKGTGEHDYALLAITQSAGKQLPGAFPAIALSHEDAHLDDLVYIGSYGAQELTSAEVRTSLAPTLATSTVTARYTFKANTPDVLAIAGSPASQEGSSGGAVVDEAGDLVGLITTSDIAGDYRDREMRVITPSYIRRSFKSDTGKDFDSYFGSTSLPTLLTVYASTSAELGAFLAKAIGIEQ